jgi:hypothetical protein
MRSRLPLRSVAPVCLAPPSLLCGAAPPVPLISIMCPSPQAATGLGFSWRVPPHRPPCVRAVAALMAMLRHPGVRAQRTRVGAPSSRFAHSQQPVCPLPSSRFAHSPVRTRALLPLGEWGAPHASLRSAWLHSTAPALHGSMRVRTRVRLTTYRSAHNLAVQHGAARMRARAIRSVALGSLVEVAVQAALWP